jgi:hypothetical protein
MNLSEIMRRAHAIGPPITAARSPLPMLSAGPGLWPAVSAPGSI